MPGTIKENEDTLRALQRKPERPFSGILRIAKVRSALSVRACGEMDITAAFEAAFGGSNPSGRTTKKLRLVRGFFVCARRGFERAARGLP